MTERTAYKFRYDPDTDPSRTGAAWQASGLSRNNPRPVTALKRGRALTERTALPFALWVTVWAVAMVAALALLITIIAWFVVP